MAEGMLTLNEVMQYLGLDKKGVESLIKKDKLQAYKIGGTYLRFEKDQVAALQQRIVGNKSQTLATWGWMAPAGMVQACCRG